MPYRVILFSPDEHVIYDGRTPDERGIGGGVTARVRLLKALAAYGHEVVAYVNCSEPGVYDRVLYRPYREARDLQADVLILTTSGGALDLSPIGGIRANARLRIAWIHGAPKPKGLEAAQPDFFYVCSNFIKDVVANEWGIDRERIFVCYNGLEQAYFRDVERDAPERDPFRLVYIGHPSKGLQHALRVLSMLRARDPRFRLDVYGGYEIWGQPPADLPVADGVAYQGLVGQRELIRRLFSYGFCLAIQEYEEPFGIAVQECKRAGVVVIASKVGAFNELIHDGYDGFLVDGPANCPETHQKVAELILDLLEQPEYVAFVRENAQATPWDWALAARTWTAHWDRCLRGVEPSWNRTIDTPRLCCPSCRTPLQSFPDGWRCLKCAHYYPMVNGIASFTPHSGTYSEIYEKDLRKLLGLTHTVDWKEAVVQTFGSKNLFLFRYILEESRGFFHFWLDLPSEGWALDVGAGFGAVSVGLARRYPVVALDNHWLRLAFLRRRCLQDKLERIKVFHGDALALPFDDQQFALVTLVGVLEWVGTWQENAQPEDLQLKLLQEVYRVLKPGGYAVIGIENRYGLKYLLGEPDDHTGIRHITYLPREEQDILSKSLKGIPYRVRTHGRAEYERLLRTVGFQRVTFYAAYPDYRLWSSLIPLDSHEVLQFYVNCIELDTTQRGVLERVFAERGSMADWVDTYFIVGQR